MSAKRRNPHVVQTVRCAGPGCANVRREANHWFITSAADEVFLCRPYAAGAALAHGDEPVCGQACAQKVFEKYLAGHRQGNGGERAEDARLSC